MTAGRRTAVRALRALYRQLALSRVAGHIPPRLFWSVRRRLLPLRSADVLEVVAALEGAGVPAWVTGGWGVDGLLGRQTRTHGDLDLALELGQGAEWQACLALRRLGFELKEDRALDGAWVARRLRLQDGAGRIVELLLIDGAGLGEQSGGLVAQGTIDGRPVACLSPAAQLTLHLGYRPYGTQRHDVRHLCRRFHLPIPEPYR
jgi:lincosamide nucleotidyltransferase A/C/D/E